MMQLSEARITLAQYLDMPTPRDGSRFELIRGKLVRIPWKGIRDGHTQGRFAALIQGFGEETNLGRAVIGTGFVTARNPDTVRGFDVSYWSAERLPFDQCPVGYPTVAPDLGIDVLTATNRRAAIREKMEEYFHHGTLAVWIVDPENRTVTIYRSLDEGRLLHENATLSGEDVLPGFTCKVAELFE